MMANIDLSLPIPIGAALLLSILSPLILKMLSHRPLRIEAAGLRFQVGVACAWGGWLALLAAEWSFGVAIDPLDVMAGGMILACGCLSLWIIYGLLCWGFTLCLLMSIDAAGRFPDAGAWATTYCGAAGVKGFTADRLAVVFMFDVATLQGRRVLLTSRGRLIAALSRIVRPILNIQR